MTTTLERDISEVGSRRVKLRTLAEQICRKHLPEVDIIRLRSIPAHSLRPLSEEECAVFDELDWTPKQVADEFERVAAIAKFETIAGTKAERDGAAKRLAEAKAVAQKRRPLIANEIAKLQKELGAIDEAQSTAQSEVSRRGSAFAQLKKFQPDAE